MVTAEQQRNRRKNKTAATSHRPNWGQWVALALLLQWSGAVPTAGQYAPVIEEPTYYYVGCYTARTDLLKESIYAKTPQTCIEICEHQTYSYAILSSDRCFCSNTIVAEERQSETLCNIRCIANKSQPCGGAGVHSYYSTMLAKEPAPNHLKVTKTTENSIAIAWEAYEAPKMHINAAGAPIEGEAAAAPATPPAQQITNFLIKSLVLKSYSSLPFFPQPEFIVQSTESRFEITDLHPATEYNITVMAMCGQAVCGSAALLATTDVGQPSPEPPEPRILSNTDTTITVEIPMIKNDNGPVTKVYVLVERVDDALSQPFDPELLGNWRKSKEDGLPYYIAAELEYLQPENNRKRKFIVGDGKRYGAYVNEPLENKNSHYHISLGVVSSLNGLTKTLYTRGSHNQHTITMDNFTYATFDSGRDSIIALVVTCIIFGTCLVLSLITYFYLRYKTYQAHSSGRGRNAHEMTLQQQPIIERENNGFVVEDELPSAENFKEQFNALIESLDASRRLQRNALRMNVNNVIADGRYGEVITGHYVTTKTSCQLHVLSLDELSSQDQAHLLKDLRNIIRLQRHEHILDFYGVSASPDWIYLVFEHQPVSLKSRLIESRRAPNSQPVQRLTALSEPLILQWIYEVASALDYLSKSRIVHRQLCSHNIFVCPDAKVKVSVFGPIPFANNQKPIDISRWLAPEALRYQHFSTKSDVWAFACVAWECCTLGGTLYANINKSQKLLDAIKSGSRPAQPSFVYQDLYQLLLNCWQLEPSERLNWEEITFNIRQLMTSPRHALCFDRIPEPPGSNVLDMLPYYLPMLEMVN